MMNNCPDCRCSLRCLEPEAAAAAWSKLELRPVVKVPYTCKLSGETVELILVSEEKAADLAARDDRLSSSMDAKLALAVCGFPACECDLATLLRSTEHALAGSLGRLCEYGVLACEVLNGMKYFRLVAVELAAEIHDA